MFKTNDLQNIMYSSMADDTNVTINNLYLYVPHLIPNVETRVIFNEATQNNYMISYDKQYTERRVILHMITQVDLGSSHQINFPKFLIGAHQTRARANTANKINNFVLFDSLSLQKNYVELEGVRYPQDIVLV